MDNLKITSLNRRAFITRRQQEIGRNRRRGYEKQRYGKLGQRIHEDHTGFGLHVRNMYQKSTFLHASGCNLSGAASLFSATKQACSLRIGYATLWKKFQLKVKDLPDVAVRFLEFSAGRRSIGPGHGPTTGRSCLGLSPVGPITPSVFSPGSRRDSSAPRPLMPRIAA
jgi:hypothetical protein